jgi:hypothetical protein
MKNEEQLKEMFVEMCRHIVIGGKGFICLFENIECSDDLIYIADNQNYPILKEKMKNLLGLLNKAHVEKDYSILDKDIEAEIWELL